MATQRRVIPIVAFVAVLAALVAVRLFVGSPGGDEPSAAPTTADEAPAAASGLRFTDVTADAGLDEDHSSTDLSGESAMTAGAAVHEPWSVSDGYADGYPERIVDHAVERAESLERYERTKRE